MQLINLAASMVFYSLAKNLAFNFYLNFVYSILYFLIFHLSVMFSIINITICFYFLMAVAV